MNDRTAPDPLSHSVDGLTADQLTTQPRDHFLDGLRGLLLIIMLLNHLWVLLPGKLPIFSWLYEFLGFVSAAEGFVFLSGYVAGLVYWRVYARQGIGSVAKKAVKRAMVIYVWYLVGVLGLLSAVKMTGQPDAVWGAWEGLFAKPLLGAVGNVATLLHQPMFLEILPMYCFFLLFLPAIIYNLQKRPVVLIVVSGSIWLFAQFGLRDIVLAKVSPYIPVERSYFDASAWQVLFVAGVILAYKRFKISPASWGRGALIIVAVALLGAFFCLKHNMLIKYEFAPHWIERGSLGPLRLLNLACVVALVAAARHWLEPLLCRPGLPFLGRYSLQVFSLHLFPVYVAAFLLSGYSSVRAWVQLLIASGCIAVLFEISLAANALPPSPKRRNDEE